MFSVIAVFNLLLVGLQYIRSYTPRSTTHAPLLAGGDWTRHSNSISSVTLRWLLPPLRCRYVEDKNLQAGRSLLVSLMLLLQ